MVRWMGRDLLLSIGADQLRMVTSKKSDGRIISETDGHVNDSGERQ